jgi:NADPH-dependent curcumin reductase CurA
VVGIAGGTEKCNWLTQALGFDAAIDYKRPDSRDAFVKATPDGVRVNFENVGGEIMASVTRERSAEKDAPHHQFNSQ